MIYLSSTARKKERPPPLLTYLFALIVLLTSSYANAKKEALRVVVTETYLNMHTGPSRGHPVFHVLEKGEVITLLKSKTDWIKVETEKGLLGWIHRRHIDTTVGINGELVDLGIPDRDDFANRQWELGFTVGEFDNIDSLGVNLSWRFTKNLAAELRYTQATGRFSNSKLVSWGLVHYPFPEWRFSPFFTLANGQVDISPNSDLSQAQDTDDNFFMVGIGGHYHLLHRFLIRLEYNDYTTLPDRNENENIQEWKIGFSAFF
ncbi:MAG: SH3 domain-containing protein [Pseudomonadota bacterium]